MFRRFNLIRIFVLFIILTFPFSLLQSEEFRFFHPIKEYAYKNSQKYFMPNPFRECVAKKSVYFKMKWSNGDEAKINLVEGANWSLVKTKNFTGNIMILKESSSMAGSKQFTISSTEPQWDGRISNYDHLKDQSLKLDDLFFCYDKNQFEEFKAKLLELKKVRKDTIINSRTEAANTEGNINKVKVASNQKQLGSLQTLVVLKSLSLPRKENTIIKVLNVGNPQHMSDLDILQKNERYMTVRINKPTVEKMVQGFVIFDETILSENINISIEPSSIKEAQQFLKDQGYYNGEIDGEFGKSSIKALNKWQIDNDFDITIELTHSELDVILAQAKNTQIKQSINKIENQESPKVENETSVVVSNVDNSKIFEEYDSLDQSIINKNQIILKSYNIPTQDTLIVYKTLIDFDPLFYLDLDNPEHIKNLQFIELAENFIRLKILPPTVINEIEGFIKSDGKIVVEKTKEIPVPLKNMQEGLKILGYYTGVIDGDFGNQSVKALNRWQIDNDRNVTEQPNNLDFEIIEFQAKNKLKEIENENQIVTADAKEQSAKEEIQKEIITQAKENEEELQQSKEDDKKKLEELEKQQEKNNQELLQAQNYLNDLIEFIQTQQTNLDILEVSRLINANKVILDGTWSDKQKTEFTELKEFVEQDGDFVDYLSIKNNERDLLYKNELVAISQELESHISFLTNYLSKNITSEIVPDLLAILEQANTVLANQNFEALTYTNKEVLKFIQDKGLQSLRSEFGDIPKAITQEDQIDDEVIASDLISNLDSLPFFETAAEKDYVSFINLSETAPHAYFNIDGDIVFDEDLAYSCFYQTATPKNELFYYIVDSLTQNKFNVGFDQTDKNCKTDLLQYDIILLNKKSFYQSEAFEIQKLLDNLNEGSFYYFNTISDSKYIGEVEKRKIFANQIKKDLSTDNGDRVGYGAFTIDNQSTVLCTNVENNLDGHNSIINLLQNEFERLGYGKSITENVIYDKIDKLVFDLQRNNCGFIYSESQSLSKIVKLLDKINKPYNVIPFWYSEEKIIAEQEKQDQIRIEKLRKEEEARIEILEKEKLEQQAKQNENKVKEASQEELLRQQAELRLINQSIVDGAIELIKEDFNKYSTELTNYFKADQISTNPKIDIAYPFINDYLEINISQPILFSAFPYFSEELRRKLMENWEFEYKDTRVEIVDYGKSRWDERQLPTFIIDLTYTMKNNILGKRESLCKRIAYMDDSGYESFRKWEMNECETSDYTIYKEKNSFISEWFLEK